MVANAYAQLSRSQATGHIHSGDSDKTAAVSGSAGLKGKQTGNKRSVIRRTWNLLMDQGRV